VLQIVTPVTSVTPETDVTEKLYPMKKQVFELRSSGLSFGQIARQLGISKSTAFAYFKDYSSSIKIDNIKSPKNGSELGLNVRSERFEHAELTKKVIEPVSSLKEIKADDLVKVKFDSLNFTGKFLELIGKPSRIFSGIIWGLPKGGKSNLSVRFADYLQEYFGEVVYIAAEEGLSSSLKEKFIQIKGGNVTVVECRKRDEIRTYLKGKEFQFVFIDSINVAGIDNEFLELIKVENPKKSFISIVQATKSGNFKGDQALTHNCDFVIKVIDGVAYHHGRFGPASEVKIFEQDLYTKNPNKKNDIESTKSEIHEREKNNFIPKHVPNLKPVQLPEFKLDLSNKSKLENVSSSILAHTSQLALNSKRMVHSTPKLKKTIDLKTGLAIVTGFIIISEMIDFLKKN
jgi:hypothetical protein